MKGADSASDERSRASAGHLCVERHFLNLIESIGRAATQSSAERCRKEDGDGGRKRRESNARHDD